jgi:hypothetical protein
MQKLNDLSRSLSPLEPEVTLIAVIEMSLSSWLVAGIVPDASQPRRRLQGARPVSFVVGDTPNGGRFFPWGPDNRWT